MSCGVRTRLLVLRRLPALLTLRDQLNVLGALMVSALLLRHVLDLVSSLSRWVRGPSAVHVRPGAMKPIGGILGLRRAVRASRRMLSHLKRFVVQLLHFGRVLHLRLLALTL